MALKSNPQIELAGDFLRSTGANIFLTGRAGSGKTTFLRNIIGELPKRTVIAAPTGVAAINAGGVTLHSLFQLPFSPYIPGGQHSTSTQGQSRSFRFRMSKRKISLIRSIELLVIDEISMVRGDVLDAIDETLRRIRRDSRAFGGVQLLMIGDVEQLSPICQDSEWEMLREHYPTPYFFDSRALRDCGYITIEFQEIFRQSDPHFTSLLNAIRDKNIDSSVIESLNKRYIPNFTPSDDEGYITLSTHNNSANKINRCRLEELPSQKKIYTATIKGDYPTSAYPNDLTLELKEGAQVIFIKNDLSPEKLYYNGLLGNVISTDEKEVTILPKGSDTPITVSAVAWENVEYTLDASSGEIREDIKGSFSQLPLRCAWAITIHKSQGLSFDRAIIDASASFAHGQVYVALSRCRTLEGMVLSSPLRASSIIKDSNVESFTQYVARSQPCTSDLERHKRAYICSNICEIFSLTKLLNQTVTLERLLSAHLLTQRPELCRALAQTRHSIEHNAEKVSLAFQRQIIEILSTECDEEYLRQRLEKASEYFHPILSPLLPLLREIGEIEPDSAELQRRLRDIFETLDDEAQTKISAIELCGKGFSIKAYQQIKVERITKALGEDAKPSKGKKRGEQKSNTKKESAEKSPSHDIIHPKLHTALVNWRRLEAEDTNVKAYMILPNRSIMEIQARLPQSVAELKQISGIGDVKLRQHGEMILSIVRDFCQEEE